MHYWVGITDRDWASNIVRGRTYDTASDTGNALWQAVEDRLVTRQRAATVEEPRFGEAYLAKARLGQGAFRTLVTDAYRRRCAVTGERSLPALEAAHIRAHAAEGPKPEFEDYEPGRDTERLDRALSRQSHGGSPDDGLDISLLVDVAPKPHQAVALEALESERQSGHRRNLVVATTGTGKTWIAAFDFKRLRSEGNGDSLLFVAHRDEILRQSQQVFQLVLRESGFGERLVGGERPRSGRHVFASVQSLANRVDDIEPDDIEPDGFDVVIVDEFHHAAAASYGRLLKHLRPKFLLGLPPDAAMSSNPGVVRTSFFSFASERGMAGVWRFRTAASAVRAIGAMNRNAR